MNIGYELFIQVTSTEPSSRRTYKCSIVDKSNDFLYIDQPIQMETKRTLILSRGDHLMVSFVGGDNVVYKYSSIIVHRKMLTIPAYAILPPKKNDIKRIQRRNYVRVQTAIDVAVDCPKQVSAPFTTVTTDISGGGLACIVPAHKYLERNQLVHMYLVLPTENPTYIRVKVRVVQVNPFNNNSHVASVEFVQISPDDQQCIIRYVFGIQRKQLKKYLN